MGSYTVYMDTGGGLFCSDTVWLNAKDGSGTVQVTDVTTGEYATTAAGKSKVESVYLVYQGFLGFDTSVIPDASEVLTSVLSLNAGDTASRSYKMQARNYSWGPTLATADWQYPWSDNSLLAEYDVSGGWTADTYYAFTSEAGMADAVNKTGYTYFIIGTDTIDGIAPASIDWSIYHTSDEPGTSKDPKLEITTEDVPDFTPFVIWM